MCGLALRLNNGEQIYLNLGENFKEHGQVYAWVKALFENESTEKLCHDLKPQAQMLRKAGIGIKGKIFDTMLAHYVLQPELQHGLFQLAEHYLGMPLMDIAQVFGENWKTNQDCRKVNSAVLSEYFARQLEAVYQLAPLLHRKLEDDNVKDWLHGDSAGSN